MDSVVKHYFIVYKPRDMVSQFVSPDNVRLLGELDYDFPEGTHAIGRLDKDSEGLLLLTTDKTITRLLFSTSVAHQRTYLVQVLREISDESIGLLSSGVTISNRGEEAFYFAKPVRVNRIDPPLHFTRDTIPKPFLKTSWLEMTLTEGKYHQVRKMVQSVGHPCLRLIRTSIENIFLNEMNPGEIKELSQTDFFHLLRLNS